MMDGRREASAILRMRVLVISIPVVGEPSSAKLQGEEHVDLNMSKGRNPGGGI